MWKDSIGGRVPKLPLAVTTIKVVFPRLASCACRASGLPPALSSPR
ncbi:hypothetical protein [Caballeronia telluris]